MVLASGACCIWMLVVGAGCDPVRTGDPTRVYPAPLKVRLPSSAADYAPAFTVWRQTAGRTWTTNPELVGVATNQANGSLREVDIWPSLASAALATGFVGDPLGCAYTMAAWGTLAGTADYVFVASLFSGPSQPTGPAGPAVELSVGYQMFHRNCPSAPRPGFDPVPLDTVVSFDDTTNQLTLAGEPDPFAKRCGVAGGAVDLGDMASISSNPPAQFTRTISSVVWASGGDAVYALAGSSLYSDTQIVRLDLPTRVTSVFVAGDVQTVQYVGPLQMVAGGTCLAVNEVFGLPVSNCSYGLTRVRLSLVGAAVSPLRAELPDGALSPDGRLVAIQTTDNLGSSQVQIVDAGTAGVMVKALGPGTPLAWSPDGQSILAYQWEQARGMWRFLSMPLAGGASPTTILETSSPVLTCSPWSTRGGVPWCFWTASGPGILTQDDRGARVFHLSTGETTEIVEPQRVAAPLSTVAVTIATDQMFAWAVQCFGLGETECTAELRRLSLATGQRDVVARAAAALPFAVSPDGTKIAFGDGAAIYVKTLP